ncbi:MAG: hypothetical protein WB869_05200, partial [Candidatus Acidiferrales bacterium]
LYSVENYGEQNYQGMEVEATHRMSRGLNFAANYTGAHNRSDAQGDAPIGFGGETAYGLAALNRFAIGFGVLQSAQTAENAGNRTGQSALRFDF